MESDRGRWIGSEIMRSEYIIVRNTATMATAEALDELITGFISDSFDGPKGRLADLSSWLVRHENHQAGTARQIREFVKTSARIAEVLAESGLATIARDLVGEPVRLHEVVRFRTVMRDYDFTRSRPHQDLALWPENPNHINVWLALCDVTDDLAPLQIVPKSANQTRGHVVNEFGQQEIAGIGDAPCLLERIPVQRGEAIMFSPTLIHFSAPNTTDLVRWSIDFRFSTVTESKSSQTCHFAATT